MCIRDRRRVHGDTKMKKILIAFILAMVFAAGVLGRRHAHRSRADSKTPATTPAADGEHHNERPQCDLLPEQVVCDEAYRQCRSTARVIGEEGRYDAIKSCINFEFEKNSECLKEVRHNIPCYKNCVRRCGRRVHNPGEWNTCLSQCDRCKNKDDEDGEVIAVTGKELCSYVLDKCNEIVEATAQTDSERDELAKNCDKFQDQVDKCEEDVEKDPECYESCINNCDRETTSLKTWNTCLNKCAICAEDADNIDPFEEKKGKDWNDGKDNKKNTKGGKTSEGVWDDEDEEADVDPNAEGNPDEAGNAAGKEGNHEEGGEE
eukprot:TRINITY_DN9295_c0_g1_i2.p1 TRINITY_DN9295_c0_g1~~TRINITY_DN9295_c0_g1_i2.p1  ORF type:complete len:319 (-),score=103.15 TRINITY_DN9295_c0_g1_i2:121-1077(-)